MDIENKIENYTYQYKQREQELLDFIKYVPVNKCNLNTNSLFFTDFILKTCPLVENAGEEIFSLEYKKFTMSEFTKMLNPPCDKCNLSQEVWFYNRFAAFCNENLSAKDNTKDKYKDKFVPFNFWTVQLSTNNSDTLISHSQPICPFQGDASEPPSKDNNNLGWWRLNNKIKHDLSHELVPTNSTFLNALKALGASYVLLNFLSSIVSRGKYEYHLFHRASPRPYEEEPSKIIQLTAPPDKLILDEKNQIDVWGRRVFRLQSKIFTNELYWIITDNQAT